MDEPVNANITACARKGVPLMLQRPTNASATRALMAADCHGAGHDGSVRGPVDELLVVPRPPGHIGDMDLDHHLIRAQVDAVRRQEEL